MSSVVSFGTNTNAKRKRVYYTGSGTIRQGMPLCYDYDTTTNVLGYNKAGSANGTTTADGSQNEGKFLRVEAPSADNAEFLAGFVAQGGEVGKTGPRWLDIFVPNDSIIPVWTDKSITVKDELYLEAGELTVVNATQVGMLAKIGVAVETVDRSSTAGIVLAKVHMPKQNIVYGGTLGIGFSEALWEDCPFDAIARNPGLGIAFFDDYMSDHNPTTAEGWVITQTTTGTLTMLAGEGGALHFDTAGSTTADDGLEAQLLNCRVLPAAGKTIWFEARVKMNDATDQYYVGLAATDTSLIASGVLDDVVDKCGFVHAAADTDNKISSVTARTSAEDETSDVADNADGTYTTLGFRISGLTSVEFYVNGALVETGVTAANIPNAAMCLSFACKIEGTGTDAEMDVDWVRIAQLGARA
jgi:hypothetical protein